MAGEHLFLPLIMPQEVFADGTYLDVCATAAGTLWTYRERNIRPFSEDLTALWCVSEYNRIVHNGGHDALTDTFGDEMDSYRAARRGYELIEDPQGAGLIDRLITVLESPLAKDESVTRLEALDRAFFARRMSPEACAKAIHSVPSNRRQASLRTYKKSGADQNPFYASFAAFVFTWSGVKKVPAPERNAAINALAMPNESSRSAFYDSLWQTAKFSGFSSPLVGAMLLLAKAGSDRYAFDILMTYEGPWPLKADPSKQPTRREDENVYVMVRQDSHLKLMTKVAFDAHQKGKGNSIVAQVGHAFGLVPTTLCEVSLRDVEHLKARLLKAGDLNKQIFEATLPYLPETATQWRPRGYRFKTLPKRSEGIEVGVRMQYSNTEAISFDVSLSDKQLTVVAPNRSTNTIKRDLTK